eukprot:TRINITY_DN2192_c0_g1_i6.p1 TRINITY_DN2192_c0_g1~~TRINITY_DN2192_c0_g1_i6.p1  ORF type:complete len:682 (+),score=87.79 TRINITY_DN2192_c0_g1_i6:43-2088(+)
MSAVTVELLEARHVALAAAAAAPLAGARAGGGGREAAGAVVVVTCGQGVLTSHAADAAAGSEAGCTFVWHETFSWSDDVPRNIEFSLKDGNGQDLGRAVLDGASLTCWRHEQWLKLFLPPSSGCPPLTQVGELCVATSAIALDEAPISLVPEKVHVVSAVVTNVSKTDLRISVQDKSTSAHCLALPSCSPPTPGGFQCPHSSEENMEYCHTASHAHASFVALSGDLFRRRAGERAAVLIPGYTDGALFGAAEREDRDAFVVVRASTDFIGQQRLKTGFVVVAATPGALPGISHWVVFQYKLAFNGLQLTELFSDIAAQLARMVPPPDTLLVPTFGMNNNVDLTTCACCLTFSLVEVTERMPAESPLHQLELFANEPAFLDYARRCIGLVRDEAVSRCALCNGRGPRVATLRCKHRAMCFVCCAALLRGGHPICPQCGKPFAASDVLFDVGAAEESAFDNHVVANPSASTSTPRTKTDYDLLLAGLIASNKHSWREDLLIKLGSCAPDKCSNPFVRFAGALLRPVETDVSLDQTAMTLGAVQFDCKLRENGLHRRKNVHVVFHELGFLVWGKASDAFRSAPLLVIPLESGSTSTQQDSRVNVHTGSTTYSFSRITGSVNTNRFAQVLQEHTQKVKYITKTLHYCCDLYNKHVEVPPSEVVCLGERSGGSWLLRRSFSGKSAV